MSRISKSLLMVCGLWPLFICACGRPREGRADHELSSAAHIDPAVTQQGVRGVYLAGLSAGEAWLIYLDTTKGASAMYRPYRSLAVCELQADSNGDVSFRSAEMTDGTVYEFTGRLSIDGLIGAIKRVGMRTGAIVQNQVLTLRRVNARFLSGSPDAVSGEYDQVQVSTESGDISGTEVVLVDVADRVVGLSVDYDGGPLPPRELSGERVGNMLHLTWRSPARIEVDTAVLQADTLKAFRGHLQLVKRLSLPELFQGPNRRECH